MGILIFLNEKIFNQRKISERGMDIHFSNSPKTSKFIKKLRKFLLKIIRNKGNNCESISVQDLNPKKGAIEIRLKLHMAQASPVQGAVIPLSI